MATSKDSNEITTGLWAHRIVDEVVERGAEGVPEWSSPAGIKTRTMRRDKQFTIIVGDNCS